MGVSSVRKLLTYQRHKTRISAGCQRARVKASEMKRSAFIHLKMWPPEDSVVATATNSCQGARVKAEKFKGQSLFTLKVFQPYE